MQVSTQLVHVHHVFKDTLLTQETQDVIMMSDVILGLLVLYAQMAIIFQVVLVWHVAFLFLVFLVVLIVPIHAPAVITDIIWMEVVLVKLVYQIVLPAIVLSRVLKQLMATMFLLIVFLENIPVKWLNVLLLVPLVLIREIFVYLV